MPISEKPDPSITDLTTRGPLLTCHVSLLLITVIMLCISIWFFGIPVPRVHDEFAYLLQSETLASFRCTNPTPEYHEFLETFHVIMQPSYNAKYFPGQALPLVLGRFLGVPIIGIWLLGLALVPLGFEIFRRVGSLFCAFVVTLFIYTKFFLFSYFGHSYWGGSFFMLCGGAMLLGVLLYREGRWRGAGLTFGLGAGFCLITRPFEGFFWGIACLMFPAVLELLERRKKKDRKSRGAGKAVLVVMICLMVFGSGLLMYNRAVTGNCLTLPYTIYGQEYMPSYRSFIWENPIIKTTTKPMVFNAFNDRYLYFNAMGTSQFIHNGLIQYAGMIQWLLPFYTWILFPLFAIFLMVRRDYYGFVLLFFILMMSVPCILTTNNFWEHYYAPWVWIGGLFYSLLLYKCLKMRWLDRPRARWRVRCIIAATLLPVFLYCGWEALTDPEVLGRWFGPLPGIKETLETEMLQRYRNTGQRHLVFVEYESQYLCDFEFVYNSADPYSSPIVWARSLGPDRNRVLMDYLSDRRVWQLQIGKDCYKDLHLAPYPNP